MEKKEIWLQKTVVVWLGAMLCCALWGSAFPCIKIGYRLFGIASDNVAAQILFAGCRFTLAGILALAIGSVLNRRLLVPKRRSYGRIFILALLQTVAQYLFFYIGLAHTTGVKASIIESVNVFIAILVASVLSARRAGKSYRTDRISRLELQQEKLTAEKLIGCAVGFAGVVLVNISGSGFDFGFSLMGEGFIFLSTIAYAFSSVFLKCYSKEDNPVMLSGWQFVVGGIVMMLCGFLAGGRLPHAGIAGAAMLFYLAVISAVAYSLWGILLKYNPVSRVAVFGFMNPVFGVLLSAVLLQETDSIGITSIAALALVCIGIYVSQRSDGEGSAKEKGRLK